MAQQPASLVLAQFAANMTLITSETPAQGFTPSGERLTIGKEPDSAIDGLYTANVVGIPTSGKLFGNAETTYEMLVDMEIGYFRGGGDMGGTKGGDLEAVQRNAADDVMRVSDVLTNPANYAGSTTGIREVRFQGAERTISKAHAEVWTVHFWVSWRSDLLTS